MIRKLAAPSFFAFVLAGCRAVIGVEDLHVDDGGVGDAADGGDAGASFAACAEQCRQSAPAAATSFYGSVDNCLCANKTPRACLGECSNYCDQPDPQNLTAACRACIARDALAPNGVCANVQCGGGGGGCGTYVNCVKACPR
jgi:hypothetical protein